MHKAAFLFESEAKPAREIVPDAFTFSVCTVFNDPVQYDAVIASFRAGGFDAQSTEFLYVDNRASNAFDGYSGLSLMLSRARGRYVILCHQDIRLLEPGREALEARLEELTRLDPHWGVAGNAGGVERGRLAIRISDPHGESQNFGPFPAPVVSIDENFMIVRREAMIAPSHDLKGFHLYGADLCTQARMRGYNAYVIDFHLRHLGGSTSIDRSYYDCLEGFEDKYNALMQSLWVQTTCLSPVMTASKLKLAATRFSRMRKKWSKLRKERLKRKSV